MKAKIVSVTLLMCIGVGYSQRFVNLDFETTTITTIHNPGGDTYTAKTPGWSVNTFNYVNGDPNSIPYNNIALDSASVNLEGTNSPYAPAIQGLYSILLQGGTAFAPTTNGASIWQTAQVPVTAQSITYWGNALQVFFDGQLLSFVAVSNSPSFTLWEANISAYAGQTGQLEFTEPWQNSGLLDNIQFSSSPVPEPGVFGLSIFGGLALAWKRWRKAA